MKNLMLFILSFLMLNARSQNWNEVQKIVATDRGTDDRFGNAVCISENYAIVGASNDKKNSQGNITSFNQAGSAYIFKKDSIGRWNEVQKLVASDRATEDFFGNSVSISNNVAIVGANFEDEDENGANTLNYSGSAYIFERDSTGVWFEVQKIVASDRTLHSRFGTSVAIDGSYAIVGAPGDDNFGAAYIFEKNQNGIWIEVQKFVASVRGLNDLFGISASISGDIAIVGADQDKEDEFQLNSMFGSGSAYIFERDEGGFWGERQKIVASDRSSHQGFGYAVEICNNSAIVGTFGEDLLGNYHNVGAAYIFERQVDRTWIEIQKLTASDAKVDDLFGHSVSIYNDYALVGKYLESENIFGLDTLSEAGAAYLFERDNNGNWSEIQKIIPSDRAVEDQFGISVSISGNYTVVGAWLEDENPSGNMRRPQAGSAYIFELNPSVAIAESNSNPTFTIFPNPTYGHLTINLHQYIEDVDITVTNVLGEMILMKQFEGNQPVSFKITAPSGLYLVKITTRGKSEVVRIVKEKM